MKKVKTLTIDRAKWFNGSSPVAKDDPEYSLLLRRDGRMCCLGFAALRFGFNQNDIRGRCGPSSTGKPKLWPRWLRNNNGNTAVCSDLIRYNDGQYTNGEKMLARDREARIKIGFALGGIQVKFVGRSPRKAPAKRKVSP